MRINTDGVSRPGTASDDETKAAELSGETPIPSRDDVFRIRSNQYRVSEHWNGSPRVGERRPSDGHANRISGDNQRAGLMRRSKSASIRSRPPSFVFVCPFLPTAVNHAKRPLLRDSTQRRPPPKVDAT